ncbi:hypothetical protein AVHY2522_03435 [Acidovorax sp. SUPP2522]|uniref:hypothetical protein n=1 Tax=unclassified Acidovorax TaxID=2684926 RepID=UPI002349E333|nr:MULTISPECIES: hypothetical protein [unclassified Acidovorax]WCM98406.1 hypothetical protein M5C96_02785 [Acidovorax sp. GBBC 1281]GKT14116.1 hypothetical protein AVHY2522_03435 [Acidovorax sp. SUPP2522]
MKKLFISFFTAVSVVAFAQADAPARNSIVKINGHEFILPTGCVQIDGKRYRFRCLLSTGEDVALGVDEGPNFEKIIKSPNDKEGVLDRVVQETSYGYYVKYLSRKNGNQYNFIYLKDKEITVFGGDVALVYYFSMLINNVKIDN